MMIRQLAICCTSDGVIGYNGALAFHSKLDMAMFVKFTKRTVLVCGRKTAQEMVERGFVPSAERPLLVISENGVLDFTVDSKPVHIYYAFNYETAIDMAEEIAESSCLTGYTIVGGKSIYDQFFASKDEIDAAYLALIDSSQEHMEEEALKIRLDLPVGADVEKAVRAKLVNGVASATNDTAVTVELSEPAGQRAVCNFVFMYAASILDPKSVRVTAGGYLRIKAVDGEHVLHTTSIQAYSRERDRDCMTIIANGLSFKIRLNSVQEINFLQHTLDQLIVKK